MNGRNINPENKDFIIREAEKIVNDYIRVSKSKASKRRRKLLRKQLRKGVLKELLFGAFLALGIGVLLYLLLYFI
jgi:hypothetical protein